MITWIVTGGWVGGLDQGLYPGLVLLGRPFGENTSPAPLERPIKMPTAAAAMPAGAGAGAGVSNPGSSLHICLPHAHALPCLSIFLINMLLSNQPCPAPPPFTILTPSPPPPPTQMARLSSSTTAWVV